jgi:ABC-type branched-subunit amino acid transport system substrate-binding protein
MICGSQAQTFPDSIVYKPEVEREFVEAMKLFKAEKYDSASLMFVHNLKEYPRSHRSTGSFIMGAKAFYELKNYRESIRLLKDLIDLYPQSNYVDDAHYTLGLDYYRIGRYEDAATQFIIVIQSSLDKRLVARSEKLIEMLTSTNLTLSELQLLQDDAASDEMKSLVTVRIAENILRTGDFTGAGDMLRKVAALPPNNKYVNEALSLLEQMEKRGGVKIGVVLPLMVKTDNLATRALGVEFLQGVQLAVDEYNQTVPVKIGLEVRDTEKDLSVAARQVADLCSDDKVAIVIGPILSNEVFASAGIANERGVPLVTPTATANGIAAIGPFVFQANPDFNIRGRNVASFAYHSLHARTFAVLAPTDAVQKQMAESFIAEIDSLHGEVIDVEWYNSGSMDLKTELMTMRRKALEKLEVPIIDFSAKMKQAELNKIIGCGVNQQILDSLIERGLTAPVTLLFGAQGKVIADSLQLPTRLEKLKYDSLGLPVPNIDVIFVPIASSDEIPIVSSQLKFFNIQAQAIGTGDWNDVAALDQNRLYTDGIMFSVDSYINTTSETQRAFEAKYRLANNNTPPGTNALYGYDVAKMVVQIIAQGKSKRKDIAAALAQVEGFEGLHSKISLSQNRVNSCLTIMQYKGQRILRIGEVDLARQRN